MNMPPTVMSKSDKDFEAEHDFRTLQAAAEIGKDKKRLDRAIKAGENKQKATEDALSKAKGLRRK